MGKKKNDSENQHQAAASERLGFAAAHNNSWYSSTDPGEQKDTIVIGRFPPLKNSFKRPSSLLDPFDKTLNTAMTGERYSYMFSCNDILHRDYPLRYSASAVDKSSKEPQNGSFKVLPRPKYAAEVKHSGNRNARVSTLPQQPTLLLAKGAQQQGCSADGSSRFNVRTL